jgi:hypothetical protein
VAIRAGCPNQQLEDGTRSCFGQHKSSKGWVMRSSEWDLGGMRGRGEMGRLDSMNRAWLAECRGKKRQSHAALDDAKRVRMRVEPVGCRGCGVESESGVSHSKFSEVEGGLVAAGFRFGVGGFFEGVVQAGDVGGAFDGLAFHQFFDGADLEFGVLLVVEFVGVEAGADGFGGHRAGGFASAYVEIAYQSLAYITLSTRSISVLIDRRMLCSQILTTRHPRARKMRITRKSRRRFAIIFSRQKALFILCFQRGNCQPCQKSLSRKTQTLCFRNTRSGLPNTSVQF